MAQVYVKYNPYRLRTQIAVNGHEIETDSSLYKLVKGKRLQEWIGKFPQMLRTEFNSIEFDLEFSGMNLDWDDFQESFRQAENAGIIRIQGLHFEEIQSDEEVADKIGQIFCDLQEGPIDDFRDTKLLKAFDNVQNAVFPINVIATMSAGKSTLINALLHKKLMPSKSEACTAAIIEILDRNTAVFSADVFDKQGEFLLDVKELTYDIMSELNEDERVSRIEAEGNIPFLDSRSMALMLVDTPGPNNSQNQAHKNTTYQAIRDDSNNLILYVLNGTQLKTKDDARLLRYAAGQIKKGGKQVRDRFLFVVNKMDEFNPEEEDIAKTILSVKDYLSQYGIEDPQIFPCSAFAALNIRTYLKDIDIGRLTWEQMSQMPSAAGDTLPMIYKFVNHKSMHLEQYSTLSPSAQSELNYRLMKAQERGDIKEQALIHCGICSIEAAITAYVKKYAKTKKIKDLAETFEEVLESSQVLVKAKTEVAKNEEAARECAKRAALVKEMIEDGKEAEKFKEKIAQLNPMGMITDKAEKLKESASAKTVAIFRRYGETITSREEAKRLVSQFADMSSDSIAEISSELESVIHHEVVDTGEKILMEYQEKLFRLDESAASMHLDFATVDLVKGVLSSMRETVKGWNSDEFAADAVKDVGKTEYETRTYYEKTGQKEEEIITGSHQEKIGTRKVKTGSHRQKVGTKKVKNPKKQTLFGFLKFWEEDYIEEAVYKDIDDYEDEDVYETVMDYKTIMRDVYELREETIEKFSAETDLIQTGLIRRFRQNLDEGIESALAYAYEQVSGMKKQFASSFDALDRLIEQKYNELDQCANNQSLREAELEKNQNLLNWIAGYREMIDKILDM